MHVSGPTPHPYCECLWWGVSEIANTTCNTVTPSIDHFVAADWHHFLITRITEAAERGVGEVRKIMSVKLLEQGSELMRQDPKDHFPGWYQDIVKKRISEAIAEARARITANEGAPGPAARAAREEAEEHYRQYHFHVDAGGKHRTAS